MLPTVVFSSWMMRAPRCRQTLKSRAAPCRRRARRRSRSCRYRPSWRRRARHVRLHADIDPVPAEDRLHVGGEHLRAHVEGSVEAVADLCGCVGARGAACRERGSILKPLRRGKRPRARPTIMGLSSPAGSSLSWERHVLRGQRHPDRDASDGCPGRESFSLSSAFPQRPVSFSTRLR